MHTLVDSFVQCPHTITESVFRLFELTFHELCWERVRERLIFVGTACFAAREGGNCLCLAEGLY